MTAGDLAYSCTSPVGEPKLNGITRPARHALGHTEAWHCALAGWPRSQRTPGARVSETGREAPPPASVLPATGDPSARAARRGRGVSA